VPVCDMRWFGVDMDGTEPCKLLNTAKCFATAVLIGSWEELNILIALSLAPLP